MKPILFALLSLSSIQWEKSTGPKSEEGKTRSAMRGFKGGTREMLRELARMLREQTEALKRIG